MISQVTLFGLRGDQNALYEFSSGDLAFAQGQVKNFFFLNTYQSNLHVIKVDFSKILSSRELFVSERRRIEIPNIADFSQYAVPDEILSLLKNHEGQKFPDAQNKIKIQAKMCVTRSQIVVWLKDVKKVIPYSVNSVETSLITIPLGAKSWYDQKQKKAILLERKVVGLICSQDGQSFQIISESLTSPSEVKPQFLLHTFYDSDGTQGSKKKHSESKLDIQVVNDSVISSIIPVSQKLADLITTGKKQEFALRKMSSVYPDAHSSSNVLFNQIFVRISLGAQVQKIDYLLTYLSGPKLELCTQQLLFDFDFNRDIRPELERFPKTSDQEKIRQLRVEFDTSPKILFTGNDRNKRTVIKLTFWTGDKFSEAPKTPEEQREFLPLAYEASTEIQVNFFRRSFTKCDFKEFIHLTLAPPQKTPLEHYIKAEGPLFEVRLPEIINGGPPYNKPLSYWIGINQKLAIINQSPTIAESNLDQEDKDFLVKTRETFFTHSYKF